MQEQEHKTSKVYGEVPSIDYNPEQILNEVCAYYAVSVSDFKTRRAKGVSLPAKRMLFFLLNNMCNMSPTAISRYLTINRLTIRYHVKRMEWLTTHDNETIEDLGNILPYVFGQKRMPKDIIVPFGQHNVSVSYVMNAGEPIVKSISGDNLIGMASVHHNGMGLFKTIKTFIHEKENNKAKEEKRF